jgi:hypothetical protein
MADRLQPHPLAALFPELPPEELTELARDIKARGQLEPIIVYKGLILDGRNRYLACQKAGVKPQTVEYDPKTTKRSPEELVVSRNLRRRHLSGGQKAAIALEWSEQVELSPNVEEKGGRGRPKGALSKAAQKIGISEQRVFEVRQIRKQSATLYQEVKAGNRSLISALAEISQPREPALYEAKVETPGLEEYQGRSLDPKKANVDQRPPVSYQVAAKKSPGFPHRGSKEISAPVTTPASRAAIEESLNRIKAILGNWFYAEVRGGNLIEKPEEVIQFAKVSDAQMKEIGPLLKRGWAFTAASREVIERLTPDNEIRALHTRAVANGGDYYQSTVGNFAHIVIGGPGKDKILAKFEEIFASLSATRRS